jgi:drug/metabolite transporter (DMT)-like permease
MLLTALAMLAFAGNSLLCRIALKQTSIDPASFTTIRLASGAITLALIASLRRSNKPGAGNWPSALALFIYAAGFSFAYLQLTAATGALLLFGAVQVTMILYGIWKGERLHKLQIVGLLLAFCGLIGLLLPGLSAPPLQSAALMLSAGVAWGIYSLRGKGVGDPTQVTAGNFVRTIPVTALLSALLFLFCPQVLSIDTPGAICALASGAIASGIGYAIWYTAIPMLKASSAATVQLSVPVIAAIGGIFFLGERPTLQLILATPAILGGIALVIFNKQSPTSTQQVPTAASISTEH